MLMCLFFSPSQLNKNVIFPSKTFLTADAVVSLQRHLVSSTGKYFFHLYFYLFHNILMMK